MFDLNSKGGNKIESFWWKDLKEIGNKEGRKHAGFAVNAQCALGNGYNIRFWKVV